VTGRYLIFMTGIAGAGKSYFAERLSKKLPAVWLNSDGVRTSMYENAHDHSNMTDEKNRLVFAVMDYASKQAFAYGAHVIYDAANNTEPVRAKVRKFARECGVKPVLVLVETPQDIAFERATTRLDGLHAWAMPPERHKSNVERFEPVQDSSGLVTIDGTIPFDEQFKSFREQLDSLEQRRVET
jgi:predicted kinase